MITDTFNKILRYKKGLFRVWVVLSAIWIVSAIWYDYDHHSYWAVNSDHSLFNSLSDYKYCSSQTYRNHNEELREFRNKISGLSVVQKRLLSSWLKYTEKLYKQQKNITKAEKKTAEEMAAMAERYVARDGYVKMLGMDARRLGVDLKWSHGEFYRLKKADFACSPQERLLEKAKIIFLPPLFLLLGVAIFLITIPLIFTYFLSPIFSWVSSGFAEKEVNEESKSMKIKKEIAITYPLSSKNKGKQSRWLSVVHLIGGGALFNVFEISYILPDLGAIPTVLLLGIGYFGSYVLISNLWKKVTKKNYRIAVGVILCLVYVIIAALLAWFIDQVLF